MPRIENWVINQVISPMSKHFGEYYLHGNIYGHPNVTILEGESSSTSVLISIDFTSKIAKTLNTTYELGERGV